MSLKVVTGGEGRKEEGIRRREKGRRKS